MKRFIYCAIIALITISCNESEEPWNKADSPLVIPKTFYAQAPIPDSNTRAVAECQPEEWDEAGTVHTRTYAVVDPANASEYFQYWSAGDAISVFFTTKNLQYTLQSYQNGELDYGIFELAGEEARGSEFTTGYYYSVYPYKEATSISKKGKITYEFPQIQHYNGDSYANGENGMVAIEETATTDSVLYFQNFCSYLQLRLVAEEGAPMSVKKISLIANNDKDAMAGEGTVEVDGTPVVEMKRSASSQIGLRCGSGVELSQDVNNPSRFWFVLPGGFTFSQGFSIIVTFDDYSYFKQTTTKRISIERSHIKPMATIIPNPKPSTQPIRYKYNDTSINEPFPLENTFFGEDGLPLDIVEQVYDAATGEWIVLLSGTIKSIGDNSFEGPGPDLEYIKIDSKDNSVTLNNFAFYNCTADYVIINSDVDKIGESAFTGSTIKDLNIYGDVTTIGESAGTGSNIENIKISGDVETIIAESFSGCNELATIEIEGNVETIQQSAFYGCTGLLTIDIDGNVGEFEKQAFSGCTALQTVNVGGVDTISYRAFYMCTSLKEANIPGVKYLGMGAFRGCTNLETITLDDVVIIDDNAFMDCKKLTSAVISENCTMIGEGAFCNASNLKTVYCYAVYPPFIKTDNYNSSYVFDSVHEDICIYIPMGSYDDYTDDEYFEGQEFDDPYIEAEVNWWYEEYEDVLYEMEE